MITKILINVVVFAFALVGMYLVEMSTNVAPKGHHNG